MANVERITHETVKMFGWMPYRRFQFLFEDGASGGLEHLNSISIGVRRKVHQRHARDPNSPLSTDRSTKFFHVWTEVQLRPASWIGSRHGPPAPAGELWWAEGVTLYCRRIS